MGKAVVAFLDLRSTADGDVGRVFLGSAGRGLVIFAVRIKNIPVVCFSFLDSRCKRTGKSICAEVLAGDDKSVVVNIRSAAGLGVEKIHIIVRIPNGLKAFNRSL